ncbi:MULTISPECIES: bifunctional 2',3'-cyclic-nucleotide 2'-phosphodiesterase/3'-nucleotidase [unclassified Ruegeria]|uniref:bifunctional 2',3'-cyclic-nucleotide 2'-phosphodiesterase/3'-nucleotidase n=1 Tax=unclassified Ruegeria TaxID=2625375 RepID=UPI0024699C24|nr:MULTISPECIES: bifunctional 2',3'-cyclic-nucleotide 2'-phosphodiesterase/3'-nucleotidase [unclassified Ruegeria]
MQHPPSSLTATIRILGTSDLHMNVTGFDYYRDAPEPMIGFTRTATLIRQARTEAKDALTILLDNGDSLQGTPIGEWAVTQTQTRHPLMEAFEALDYDAIGLGNHDFGFGLQVLDRILPQSPCPVLCSNTHRLDRPGAWSRQTVLRRTMKAGGREYPIRIGVFSALPPQTANWEAHRLEQKVRIDDILSTARHVSQELKATGCDLVIALAHSGIGTAQPEPNLENAVIPVAAIEPIDAIIAGHSHLTLPGASHKGFAFVDSAKGQVHGKPVVMPGSAGSHLGVIDLTMTLGDDGKWHVETHRSHLKAIAPDFVGAEVLEDPELSRIFAKAHRETRAQCNTPVGHTSHHLHSYFSFCAWDRGLALVAAAQAAALRQHVQGTAYAGLPVLSAVAPSKFGGRAGPRFFTDIPPGQICTRHVADLNVFPNEMQAVIVSGTEIKDWLEMSAGVLNQMRPGEQSDLVDANRAGHNFDVLHGLTYALDLASPARFDTGGAILHPNSHRVRELRFNGRPIDANQRFVVALNNYRANGGGNFPFAENATRIPLPVLPIQHIVRDYLSGVLPIDPLEEAPQPFRLSPIPGAHALVKTGEAADQHLEELVHYRAKVIGPDAKGFLNIQLSL